MIEIDGGDGGGQLLRYALAASASTGIGFEMENIRGARTESGLKPQHLAAVETVGELCHASIDGAREGATELRFEPGDLDPHDMNVDIGTAGSIGLLFQSLLPLSYHTDDTFSIRAEGGTDVKWSPPIDYMARVTQEMAAMFGCTIEITASRRGFYPKGGGIAGLDIEPGTPEPLYLDAPGSVQHIEGESIASHHLKDSRVADRQRSEVRRVLRNVFPSSVDIDIQTEYVQSHSPGSVITLSAKTDESWLGADALGERGKQSEEVGKEAAQHLIDMLETGAAVDTHMADQIVPFLAEAGGRVHVPERTDHLEHAIDIMNRFYDRSLLLEEDDGRLMVKAD